MTQRLLANSLGSDGDFTSLRRDIRRIESRASADKFSDTHEAFAEIRSARGSHLFEYALQAGLKNFELIVACLCRAILQDEHPELANSEGSDCRSPDRLSSYFRSAWFAELRRKGNAAVMHELRRITDRVVETFLSSEAIDAMLEGSPEEGGAGDDAQYAFCATLRDLIVYHEACCATSNGDPKRVYQVIIVSLAFRI